MDDKTFEEKWGWLRYSPLEPVKDAHKRAVTPIVLGPTHYEEFLKRQEPLGPEFQKVLYDNLWELYDTEDDKKEV